MGNDDDTEDHIDEHKAPDGGSDEAYDALDEEELKHADLDRLDELAQRMRQVHESDDPKPDAMQFYDELAGH